MIESGGRHTGLDDFGDLPPGIVAVGDVACMDKPAGRVMPEARDGTVRRDGAHELVGVVVGVARGLAVHSLGEPVSGGIKAVLLGLRAFCPGGSYELSACVLCVVEATSVDGLACEGAVVGVMIGNADVFGGWPEGRLEGLRAEGRRSAARVHSCWLLIGSN